MLRHRARDAVLGMLIDPGAARRAHEVGAGNAAQFRLGALSGVAGHEPVTARFAVERLGDGAFMGTGPMFKGFRMQLGPMALLRADGVRVVLALKKCHRRSETVGNQPA